MRKIIPVFVLLLVATGCTRTNTRPAKTVRAELSWFDLAITKQADLLGDFVSMYCSCEQERFTTEACEEAAKTLLAAKTRGPWHYHMALYNSGIVEDRPDEVPPLIPETSSLCPKETTDE